MANKKTAAISNIEVKKQKKLDDLFDDWKRFISTKDKVNNGQRAKISPVDCFASDGFFPGYYSKENKIKILFIGRETRSISGGFNFVETSREFFENAHYPKIKNRLTNKNNFWRHILKIAYGIQKGGIPFNKIHSSCIKIADEMIENNNFGFAVINISKYSNDSKKKWQLNKNLAYRFINDSELAKTKFLQKEIKILEPDIIITANLWDAGFGDTLELCFPGLELKHSEKYNIEYCKEYNLNGKNIKLINTYHFSAYKSDKECFYDPIRKIVFN